MPDLLLTVDEAIQFCARLEDIIQADDTQFLTQIKKTLKMLYKQ